jgi:hypothetical protein
VAPECAISKGETLFSHPASARLAVEEGLRLGQCMRSCAIVQTSPSTGTGRASPSICGH